MKNLELLSLVHKPVGDIFSKAELFAHSADTTYFISNNSLYKHDFTQNTTTEVCPLNCEDAAFLKILTIEQKICIVTSDKLHIVDPEGTKEAQIVSFDLDIAAISWNPTEEVIAIVSQSGEVATYTIDYENGEVFPQGQSSVSAAIPDTVYVGWGSKDTQFRGSEGKLKPPPVEEKPVENTKPTISWRGNGEMFVVNYWADQKRKFVVFETPCKALYKSEACLGLQPPVAWRPSGNMIATLAETHKKSVVVFEKNGQRRFEFDLNFGNVRVDDLKWSPCAQILTILTENVATKTQNLHLFTCGNYKWYEKQKLVFKSDNPLVDFDWLETTHFTFTLGVVTRREIIKYTFHKVVNSSAMCAVIDGATVQLTDFTDSVIPPIMCSKKITNSDPINFVTFHNNSLVMIDAENHLKIVDVNDLESVITSVVLETSHFPLACHHFISNGSEIYFVNSDAIIYKINPETSEKIFVGAATELVTHLVQIPSNLEIFGLTKISSGLYGTIRQAVKDSYNCQLKSNCHFYVNDVKVSDCVNSFTIFGDYLLYTTKMNELCCSRFNDESFGSQTYRRNIEQGATIVTAITNSPKIVLQLPRGNLETISCRLISIDILDRLLNDKKWEEAIRFIRLEKLNANLLFDLDSNRFLGQIDWFIDGVKTISELNSVCLEFEPVNVLNTIYKNWGKSDEYPGKIDAIFGAIFKFFDAVDYAAYITTIVVINLNFFTLRKALVYLQDLLRRSYDDVTLKQKLVEAIKTLKTYGCDQEKLYSEALLLYDLDLAHFVASCCQLDPRIYEPHLNTLKNLSEVQRRYEINLFGNKPKSAIIYLLRCNTDSDTILTFIKDHNVSREAYENCNKNNRHYQSVSRAFAQSLSRRGLHHEAGVILKRGGLLKEAVEEFTLSLQWREVLDLLGELKVEEVQKLRTVNELAGRLTQSHVIKEAAILYEFYAGNYEMAVKVLLENYFFEEAVHIAKKHNRGDIIVSDVIPLLNKHKTYLEEKLTDLNDTYNKYRTRLAQVRRTRLEKLNFSYEGDDREDLFSDVGSTITKSSRSSRSRSSTASSRNRRKEEKKKQNLREGGLYEDIALIRALHCTIKEVYRKGEEVRTCCVLLFQESDISYGEVKRLHDLYWRIDANLQNGVREIWPPHFYANNQTQDVQEVADLDNFEHLDVEFRTPPSGHSSWKLHFF